MGKLNLDKIIASLRGASLQRKPETGKARLEAWAVEQLPVILPPGVTQVSYVTALEQLAIFISQHRKSFHDKDELVDLLGRVKQLQSDDPTTQAIARRLERSLMSVEVVRQIANTETNRDLINDCLRGEKWDPGFLSEASELRQSLLEDTGGAKLNESELQAISAMLDDPKLGELGPRTFEDRVLATILASRLGQDTDLVDTQLSLLETTRKRGGNRFKILANRLDQWDLQSEGEEARSYIDDSFVKVQQKLPKLLGQGTLEKEVAEWEKEYVNAGEKLAKRVNQTLAERAEAWKVKYAKAQTIQATQSEQPIWGGMCLASSSKVAAYLLQHPAADDETLAQHLKKETIEQLKALGVPNTLWPKNEHSFFALQERLAQVRYLVDAERNDEVMFRQFGLDAQKAIQLTTQTGLAPPFGKRTISPKENTDTIAKNIFQTHQKRDIQGRAIYILIIGTGSAVGHAIEIDLNDNQSRYCFWDPNFGRYTFQSTQAFAEALSDLLLSQYTAFQAYLTPVLLQRSNESND